MAYRQAIGRHGEDLACEYLQQRGYEIVERNWRCARGEIDIVARDGDCWAFVEVKTRRGHAVQYPEEGVNDAKRARLAELAMRYLAEGNYAEVDWRLDLLAIELGERSAPPRINLIQGIGIY